MLRKRQTKRATVYLVAVTLLACYLTQTEASPLRKSLKSAGWDEGKEASGTASAIREGVILFGNSLKTNPNITVDMDTGYLADSPGWHKGRVTDFSTKEAHWKRMFPSLLCGLDRMKFRAVGQPVKLFSLGQEPSLPLSQVPSTCGYNIQRNPFGLVMNIPYDGCNIVQEDGNYALQLNWDGIPVTLKCPKPDPTLPVPHGTFDPHMFPGGIIPPHFGYPWFPWPKPQEPTNAPPVDPVPTMPHLPPGLFHPHHFYHWHHLHHRRKPPTTAAPTQYPIPQGHWHLPWMYHWHDLHTYKPQDPVTTAAPKVPSAHDYMNHWLQYYAELQKPSHHPYFYPYSSSFYIPKVPTGAPATAPPVWYPYFGHMPGSYPHSQKPHFHLPPWHPAPTTASPTTRHHHPHQASGHMHFHPHLEVSSQLQHHSHMPESK